MGRQPTIRTVAMIFPGAVERNSALAGMNDITSSAAAEMSGSRNQTEYNILDGCPASRFDSTSHPHTAHAAICANDQNTFANVMLPSPIR